jgi:DNA-binding transcriptional regulator PaaX
MASPVVPASAAADAVGRVGGFSNVLVSRSHVVEGAGTLGAEELARRCVDLDEAGERYADFVDRFGRFDAATLGALTDSEAFKLRTLLVASFRRIVLSAPQLPVELLPSDWIGTRARALAGGLYAAVVEGSQRRLADAVGGPIALEGSFLTERWNQLLSATVEHP